MWLVLHEEDEGLDVEASWNRASWRSRRSIGFEREGRDKGE